ncbi:MAG: carbohydrate ABC transporter permease [Propioniciclava sp.]
MHTHRWWHQAIFLFLALLVALVFFFPIYWMLVSSLLPTSKVLSTTPSIIPAWSDLNFDAYVEVFRRSNVAVWFRNSVIVTLGSVGLSMVVSVLAGYALSRMKSKGQTVAGIAMLLTRVLPATLLVIPLFITYSSLHLLNNLWGLVLANCTVIIPFSVWLMKGFFDSIPFELEEAASIDGCGIFGAFWRVVLPLTLPGLGATTAYAFVLAWSDYLFVRTFIRDQNLWTMTVGAASFIGEHAVEWASLMAVGVIGILPVAVIFLFLEPLLVRGLAGGAVKG